MEMKTSVFNYWHELFMKVNYDYEFLKFEREDNGEVSFSKFYNSYRELGPYTEEEFEFRNKFLNKLIPVMKNGNSLKTIEEFHDRDNMYKLINRLELENSRYRYYIDKKNFISLTDEQKEILDLERERVYIAVDALMEMRNKLKEIN